MLVAPGPSVPTPLPPPTPVVVVSMDSGTMGSGLGFNMSTSFSIVASNSSSNCSLAGRCVVEAEAEAWGGIPWDEDEGSAFRVVGEEDDLWGGCSSLSLSSSLGRVENGSVSAIVN